MDLFFLRSLLCQETGELFLSNDTEKAVEYLIDLVQHNNDAMDKSFIKYLPLAETTAQFAKPSLIISLRFEPSH